MTNFVFPGRKGKQILAWDFAREGLKIPPQHFERLKRWIGSISTTINRLIDQETRFPHLFLQASVEKEGLV